MILKSYENQKIDLKNSKIVLLYGNNEGQKKEIIEKLVKKKDYSHYEQNEILDNENNFFETLLSKSFFSEDRIIVIKRVTDKLFNIIEKIDPTKLEDVNIIINAGNLEKKSKLRSKFEKDKKYVCIAFYPDDEKTLIKLSFNFFRENKISISPSIINLIVSKCSGDRYNLLNELNKIKNYSLNNKKITEENVNKLINLNENYRISELIDNCLAKNNKKIIHILNENNFATEDAIIIVRTFLSKSKKILELRKEYEKNRNIEETILAAKPPIFWKDKEITKTQISRWTSGNLKKLMYKLNLVELHLKKNIGNSINVISDFIITQSIIKTNN